MSNMLESASSLCPSLTGLSEVLFESSPDCVKILDLEGKLLSMNRNGRCIMEIDDFDAVFGALWPTLWPNQSQEIVHEAVNAARSGQNARFEAFCPTAKGQPKWWDVMVSPIFGDNGQVKYLLSVSRDVTALREAKNTASAAAERLQFVLNAAQIGEWDLDLVNDTSYRSLRHDQCFGYTEPVADWGFEKFMQHVHPEDRARVSEKYCTVLAELTDFKIECRVVWPDQSIHWIEVHGSIYHVDKKPLKMGGVVFDITKRKADELALLQAAEQSSEAARQAELERHRLNALLEAAPVGIGVADIDGQLMMANSENRRIWGQHPLSNNVDEYVAWKGWWADGSDKHGEPIKPHEWGLARALKGEEVPNDIIEIEPFGQPDVRRTVLLRATPIRDEKNQVTGSVVAQMDITAQVKAEAALRESEAKFRTITEAMPQMVWSATPDGMNDYFSQQWYDFTGAAVGSSGGENWDILFHPEDRGLAWEKWRHSLATGETFEIIYRLRHFSGEYRWTLGRALPVRDEGGRIVRWMGTCTDIHAQKLAEEELKQANQRKDEFLAMLAHELRNPLAPISTAAEILKMPGMDERRLQQSSEIISRQVKHMTNLVDDLLDVSRVTRGLINLDKENVDIKSVIASAIEQARPMIERHGHMLNLRMDANNAGVYGDRTRLVQILVNILTNAARYTPQGGEIELKLAVQGMEVEINVHDNGNGIEASLLPHIFDLFVQGKRTPDRSQGGLGLGLALVKNMVQLHGGHVRAFSAGPGKGSTFTITLPIQRQDPNGRFTSQLPKETRRKRNPLHLMLVDDNLDAAQMLAELLKAQGHRVSVKNDGVSALAEAAENPPRVCILDIGLPDLNGYELAMRLRNQPQTANAVLIALTGYGQAQDKVSAKAAGFDYHFAKPLDIQELTNILTYIE